MPPGLRAVLSKPLQELRCPFREVGQEALVDGILEHVNAVTKFTYYVMSLDVVMHAITYMHFLFLIVLGIWSYNAQLSQPQALVGAILSGSLQAIHGTAGLAPKVELQESFPETQPTNARTEPSQGRRQLPWDTWKNDDMTALPVAHVVINGMP